MADDIFDVVNENDEVVSSAPRSHVHANRLLHRSAHVLMFAGVGADRKILLQKRSMDKDTYPGVYTTSCSGHIDSGETYDEGVVREMAEETGIKVDVSRLKKNRQNFRPPRDRQRIHIRLRNGMPRRRKIYPAPRRSGVP